MTPADPGEQLIQQCTKCSALLDVSEYDPLAQVTCPVCGSVERVERMYNQFSLLDILGEGGMGTVFKALDTSLNRTVALKLLRKEYNTDAEYIAKLDMEARITASINHPHVVKVYSFGSDHNQFYIAMELVDKGTLDDLIELQGRVAEVQVLEVGIQSAAGLLAAHERGLIHRDVKPGNILFAEAHTAKITDFGLAILAEREAEVRGEVWGTPYYVAPEKLNNEPEDFRSDIYSLGATLFHALAGRPPFEAATASLVALKHLKSQAVSLQAFAPDVSNETAYVINRMLAKDPNQRYQSYEELIDHLKFAHEARLAAIADPGAKEKERVVIESEAEQTVVGWMTFVLLLVVAIAGIVLFVFKDRFFPSAAPEQTATPGISTLERGRDAMVAGTPEIVIEDLKLLLRQTADQQVRTWTRLMLATAYEMDRFESDAQLQYRTIVESGPYSKEPAAQQVIDAAKLLAGDTPIPAAKAAEFPNEGEARFLQFVLGLHNWQLEKIEEAKPFWDRFVAGNSGNAKWIDGFTPMIEASLADLEQFNRIAKSAKDASKEKKQVLVQDIDKLLPSLKSNGALRRSIETRLKDLKTALQAG